MKRYGRKAIIIALLFLLSLLPISVAAEAGTNGIRISMTPDHNGISFVLTNNSDHALKISSWRQLGREWSLCVWRGEEKVFSSITLMSNTGKWLKPVSLARGEHTNGLVQLPQGFNHGLSNQVDQLQLLYHVEREDMMESNILSLSGFVRRLTPADLQVTADCIARALREWKPTSKRDQDVQENLELPARATAYYDDKDTLIVDLGKYRRLEIRDGMACFGRPGRDYGSRGWHIKLLSSGKTNWIVEEVSYTVRPDNR